jgi:hypothetical protein
VVVLEEQELAAQPRQEQPTLVVAVVVLLQAVAVQPVAQE